jgi:hypothetical protein
MPFKLVLTHITPLVKFGREGFVFESWKELNSWLCLANHYAAIKDVLPIS